MAKRKAPKTWAEEIADLDDPAPRDLDPEDPDQEKSSDVSGSEDFTQAREHYLSIGKSKLRTPSRPTLGPEYNGSQISRDDLFTGADDSEDDPFASIQSQQDGLDSSSASEQYDDPDVADPNARVDTDEEINSNEAFGYSNDEKFEGYAFRGSRRERKLAENHEAQIETNEFEVEDDEEFGGFGSDANESEPGIKGRNSAASGSDLKFSKTPVARFENEDMEIEDTESTSSEEAQSESRESDSSSDTSSVSLPTTDKRATVRKLMAESQRAVTSNLSKAAKSDISKGRAIKHQRTTFDSLLNSRIRLQKALVAANSLPDQSMTSKSEMNPAVQAAEEAALKLWSTVDSLRQSLRPLTSSKLPTELESQPQNPTPTAPLSTLWTRMRYHESRLLPHRNTTLDKWSLKTAPISSLPRTNKFSATPTQQPLSTILQQQLTSSMEKLVQKTQIPRSCAPIQAAALASSKQKPTNGEAATPTTQIYDDADFYALLLRELVDQRMASSSSSATPFPPTVPGIKDRALRVRKNVDTKASKGRKMRYTIHEKLQNFMPPEDRGTWGERAREDLFRGLLGRKAGLEEGSEGDGEDDEMHGVEEESLRLFRR